MRKLSELRLRERTAEGRVKIYAMQDVFVLENRTDKSIIRLMINNTEETYRVDLMELEAYSFCICVNEGAVIYEKN